jgi:hypothetical protein
MISGSLKSLVALTLVVSTLILSVACIGDESPQKFEVTNTLGGRWSGQPSTYNAETIAWLGIKYVFQENFELLIVIEGRKLIKMFLEDTLTPNASKDRLWSNIRVSKTHLRMDRHVYNRLPF